MKPKIHFILLCICTILLSSCDKVAGQQLVLLIEQRTTIPEPLRKIYSVYPDGTHLQMLFQFHSGNGEYWLSPSGKQLALLTLWGDSKAFPARTLTIIELLSGDILGQVVDVGYSYSDNLQSFRVYKDAVVWSPQGDKLIFERNGLNGENTDLWLFDLTNDSVMRLTENSSDNLHPSWSPDGSRIAFASWQSCGQKLDECSSEEQYWNIMVVDADGSNLQPITNFRNTDFFNEGDHFSAKSLCNLTWSPDGKHIAFENSCFSGPLDNPHDIFLVDITNEKLERLTRFAPELRIEDITTAPKSTLTMGFSIQWATSGDMLYIGYSRSDYQDISWSLFGGFVVVNVKSGLTYHSAEIFGLRTPRNWSSDTTQFIAFTQRLNQGTLTSGPTLLGTLEPQDGTVSLLRFSNDLPYGSCDEPGVYWASEDRYVAYAMAEEGATCTGEGLNRDVAVISLSDGQITNVTESFSGDNRPIGWVIVDVGD